MMQCPVTPTRRFRVFLALVVNGALLTGTLFAQSAEEAEALRLLSERIQEHEDYQTVIEERQDLVQRQVNAVELQPRTRSGRGGAVIGLFAGTGSFIAGSAFYLSGVSQAQNAMNSGDTAGAEEAQAQLERSFAPMLLGSGMLVGSVISLILHATREDVRASLPRPLVLDPARLEPVSTREQLARRDELAEEILRAGRRAPAFRRASDISMAVAVAGTVGAIATLTAGEILFQEYRQSSDPDQAVQLRERVATLQLATAGIGSTSALSFLVGRILRRQADRPRRLLLELNALDAEIGRTARRQ